MVVRGRLQLFQTPNKHLHLMYIHVPSSLPLPGHNVKGVDTFNT